MSLNPLISVVLPTYNVELYIEEALNSILNQTIQDFEIIVIDDGSTDKTVVVIETFNDDRIKIIKKTINKGLIDSLNIGFKEAKGKYIARMDGDDISLPNRFEKQLEVLESNTEIHVCGCWLEQFGKINRIIKHKEFHGEIAAKMLLHCSMSMGSVMMVKKAIESYEFDTTKTHVEDYDFWSRIILTCKLYNIQEVLYMYRIHNEQVTEVHRQVQIEADISIKLFLFKKLPYNTKIYSDKLITKVLLLKEYIDAKEIELFFDWLKTLKVLNTKKQVFSHRELSTVLQSMRRTTVFYLYFDKSAIGIDKKWRLQTLLKLPVKEIVFVLKLKSRELKKTFIKNA